MSQYPIIAAFIQLTNKSCQNKFGPHLFVSPPPPAREDEAVKGKGVLGGLLSHDAGSIVLGRAAGRLLWGMPKSDEEAFSI